MSQGYPYPGVIVEPQGVSTSVAITDSAGNTPTVYADRFGVSTISMPDTITSRKTYFLPGEGPWKITPTANGEVTSATTLTLEDGQVATVTVGSAFTAAQWAQLGAYVPTLGVANGNDDTATINALLAAVSGRGAVKGLPGQNYQISSPLIAKSGTTLDMSGCTVTLKSGSNCNMVTNYSAANAAATASDGAVSSGSNVVTTALGAQAVVGQTLVVAGAGSGGNGPLTGKVSAATSTTITIVKLHDGSAANATATVSAATVTLYNRDSDITVKGGTWQRGSNAGTGAANHSLHFVHVDGLTVDIEYFGSSGGKYGVSAADCTKFDLNVRDANTFSDGIHIDGPAWGGKVNFAGTSGDDSVAFTCCDWPAYVETSGDIVGVHVGTVAAVSSTNLLKYIAGAGNTLDGMTFDLVTGVAALNPLWIGDDTGNAATTGGTYGCVEGGLVDAVTTNASGEIVTLGSPSAKTIKFKVRYSGGPVSPGSIIRPGGASTATIDRLEIDLDVDGSAFTTAAIFSSATTVTINRLHITGRYAPSAINKPLLRNSGLTIDKVTMDLRATFTSGGTSDYALQISAGTVNTAEFRGTYSSGTQLFRNDPTTGMSGTLYVVLDACTLRQMNRIGDMRLGTAYVKMVHPHIDTMTNAMFFTSGASYIVDGTFDQTGSSVALFQRAASESLRTLSPQLPADLSVLTPADNDMANNTNSGLSCGTGIAIHHTGGTGNGWKNLYSGATY